MRKNVFGRQFKRDTNERKAMFKNLLTSLVMEERIKTTPAKAKAIRAAADKLVTKAKKTKEEALRVLAPDVNHNAVVKLVEDIAPRFVTRHGGYTRIIKLSKNRIADNAPQVLMEWVDGPLAKVALTAEEVKAQKEAKLKKVAKKVASNAIKKEGKKATSNVAKVNKKESKPKAEEAKKETKKTEKKPASKKKEEKAKK